MLTIRQFIGGKSVRVVAVLALLPFVFALIYASIRAMNYPNFSMPR